MTSTITQSHTSAATSINSTKLPRAYSLTTFRPGEIVLDYGCGKYTDHIRKALPAGCAYLPLDPYNQPDDVNATTVKIIGKLIKRGIGVTVICSNVLNVIDSEDAIRATVKDMMIPATETGRGRVIVSIYEGDRSGVGRETKADCYQRNQRTADYMKFFPASATIKNGMITVEY